MQQTVIKQTPYKIPLSKGKIYFASNYVIKHAFHNYSVRGNPTKDVFTSGWTWKNVTISYVKIRLLSFATLPCLSKRTVKKAPKVCKI